MMIVHSHQEKPYIHLFSSNGYSFVLDLHTNRIFSLSVKEAEVIDKWLSDEELARLSSDYPDEVAEIEHLRDQGIFCTELPKELGFGASWDYIKETILNRRMQTVLEITQQCNLRCRYCTYGGGFTDHRVHSAKTMPEKVIRSAIDDSIKCGNMNDRIVFGFYGGEPLLCFDLIKMAVSYANSKVDSKAEIDYNITTNGTLITKEIALFLRKQNFNVLVSLDGPRYIHDRFRVYANGAGSYEKTLTGLRILLNIYPLDLHHKIGISVVVPSTKWITSVKKLWDDEPWLPKALRVQLSVLDAPDGFSMPAPPSDVPDSIRAIWLSYIKTRTQEEPLLSGRLFDPIMAKLHQRARYDDCRERFPLNGCCIPGARRVFVQTDGIYRVCERAHGTPQIGSVSQGVDLSRVKQLIDEYSSSSFHDCSKCFAISVCNQCYNAAYESGRFSKEKKRLACSSLRTAIDSYLEDYGLISQQYQYKLDDWSEIVIG